MTHIANGSLLAVIGLFAVLIGAGDYGDGYGWLIGGGLFVLAFVCLYGVGWVGDIVSAGVVAAPTLTSIGCFVIGEGEAGALVGLFAVAQMAGYLIGFYASKTVQRALGI